MRFIERPYCERTGQPFEADLGPGLLSAEALAHPPVWRRARAVVVFDEDTPVDVLRRLRPDVWVKGGDYAGVELPETAVLRSWGGEVVSVPYLPGHSTSELVALARGR